jgi:hypothetical protein
VYQDSSPSGGISQPEIPPETLREILRSADFIRDAGFWSEAADRLPFAIAKWRSRQRSKSIGFGAAVDMLATDVHRATGLSKAALQREARGLFEETMADAVAAELKTMVDEITARRAQRLAVPTRKPYRGTAAASRRA